MPTMRVNGTELFYEESGTGREAIVFAHGLCFSGRMFHNQKLALRERYRLISVDFRGQGRSAVASTGYDMDTLTRDIVAVIRKLDAAPCHFVGLSMGGFVGMRIALHHPELLRSLVLMNTTADPEPLENHTRYKTLALVVRIAGVRPVLGRVLPIFFGPAFLRDPERAEERAHWRRELLANDRKGIYRAVLGVVGRDGVIDEIGEIDTPTLVLAGEQDVATTPDRAQRIHERIPGSRLVTIARAGHSSCIEEPDQVNTALAEFLESLHR